MRFSNCYALSVEAKQLISKYFESNAFSAEDKQFLGKILYELHCTAKNCSTGVEKCIDSTVFLDFLPTDWVKELLSSRLLFSTAKVANQFEILHFRNNISTLQDFTASLQQANILECILMAMVKRQRSEMSYTNIENLNKILFFLNSTEVAINGFLRKVQVPFHEVLIDLKRSWLEVQLRNRDVRFEISDINALLENSNHACHFLQCNPKIILNVFSKFSAHTNISEIVDFFVTFITTEKLQISDIENLLLRDTDPSLTVFDWLVKFNVEQYIKALSFPIITSDKKELEAKLESLFYSGWTLKSLLSVFENNCSKKLESFLQSIDTLIDYDIGYDNLTELNLRKIPYTNWSSEIHKLAIRIRFSDAAETKNIQHLIYELIQQNRGVTDKRAIIEKCRKYVKVNASFNRRSQLLPSGPIIKEFKEADVTKWAKLYQNPENEEQLFSTRMSMFGRFKDADAMSFQPRPKLCKENPADENEKLAVIMRAVELRQGLTVRPIQLLSVIIALSKENQKGRLLQINTGEGKTIIIAMMAAALALDDRKVDIVTSNTLLAQKQSCDLKPFYQMFGLSVDENSTKKESNLFNLFKKRPKTYKSNIVYGAVDDFLADILRDEHQKCETRCGRPFDVVIVDEVDSMLIDERDSVVRLSTVIPGMDQLQPILGAIWNQICCICATIKQTEDGIWYFLPPDEPTSGSPIASNHEELLNFFETSTEPHIRKLLRIENAEDNYPEIKVPEYLKEFVNEQIKPWINSAFMAMYQLNIREDYLLIKDKIVPVDAQNTGIIQLLSQWTNGLHQFLQMKHGAKLTPETLMTNYISNVAFFRRYESNIYGLTGTLGTESTQQLLERVFSVDCCIIPPFKVRQYVELAPIFKPNQDEWHETVTASVLNKLANKRAVLVICKYIKTAEDIAQSLQKRLKKWQIKIYKDDDGKKIAEEVLKAGEVIIATNIAGRGTDLKVSEDVEENGGLHVCITFLPVNNRVERQNVGRTSRTGNRGTSQFILNSSELENELLQGLHVSECAGFSTIGDLRDFVELETLEAATKQMPKIFVADEIFQKFSKLHSKIGNESETFNRKYNLLACGERFGFWLRLHESDMSTKGFEAFEKEILNDFATNSLIKNPYYYVLMGNEQIISNNIDSALHYFTKALKIDKCLLANAYYNRGYAHCMKCTNKFDPHHLSEAINDFKEVLHVIENNLEANLCIVGTASSSPVYTEQFNHKRIILRLLISSLEAVIGKGQGYADREIEKLKAKLGDVQKQREEKAKELVPLFDFVFGRKRQYLIRKEVQQLDDQQKEIENQIKYYEVNRYKLDFGVLGSALKNKQKIKVKLIKLFDSIPSSEDRNTYNDEIAEFENNGYIGAVAIDEVVSINWWSVISVGLIGVAQLAVGAGLAVFSLGAGAVIGMSLIAEGVGDLISAVVDGIINRNFSWKSWSIQKVISLAVSIACAGFSAIKDAAKSVVAGTKYVANFASKTVTTTLKNGWILALKAAGLGLARGVVTEVGVTAVKFVVKNTIANSVEVRAVKVISGQIRDCLTSNADFKLLLDFDIKNRNRTYQNMIQTKLIALLQSNENQPHWMVNAGIGLVKGVARSKSSKLSAAITLAETGLALTAIVRCVPIFKQHLTDVISSIANDKRNEILLKQNVQENKVNEYACRQVQAQFEQEQKSPNELVADFSEVLSKIVYDIIQQNCRPLISAAVHGVIYKATDRVISRVYDIKEDISDYQANRRLLILQDGDTDNRIPAEYKQKSQISELKSQAQQMIDETRNGGPTSVMHLGALSDEIDRPIIILDPDGYVLDLIGENKTGLIVQVQYRSNPNSSIGHYSLPNGQEPEFCSGEYNCLLDVVATQTGRNPKELRENIAYRMEKNIDQIAMQMTDYNRLNVYNKSQALKIGGEFLDDVWNWLKNNVSIGIGISTNGSLSPSDISPFATLKLDDNFGLRATKEGLQNLAGEQIYPPVNQKDIYSESKAINPFEVNGVETKHPTILTQGHPEDDSTEILNYFAPFSIHENGTSDTKYAERIQFFPSAGQGNNFSAPTVTNPIGFKGDETIQIKGGQRPDNTVISAPDACGIQENKINDSSDASCSLNVGVGVSKLFKFIHIPRPYVEASFCKGIPGTDKETCINAGASLLPYKPYVEGCITGGKSGEIGTVGSIDVGWSTGAQACPLQAGSGDFIELNVSNKSLNKKLYELLNFFKNRPKSD